MKKIPRFVLDYMQEIQISHHTPAFLKLTRDGILIDHGGDIQRFGITRPVLNAPLEDTVFFLDCYLPLKTPGITLNKVEATTGVFADIHIFNRGDQQGKPLTWVLFLDKTETEKELRSILQKSNQLQLMEQDYHKLQQVRTTTDILKLLNTAVFEHVTGGGFKVIGTLPGWFHELFAQQPPIQQREIDLVHYFPFLEFFLSGDAQGLWKKNSGETVLSDLWIENDAHGKEYYLEAMAANVKDKKILLIKIIDSETSRNFLHIQKGREKALAFEKVVKAQRTLREFMANMSHELRTPMNVIIGISNMITRYYNDNLTPKQTKGLELIHQSGQRLLRLINDLLDLSKIEAGKMTLTLFPTKLGPLISDIEPMILSLLKDKDIGFNITQSPGLPDEFVTDEDKLRQVLLNLLGNAVKFTKQGEITLNIYPEGPMIYFEVRDTGIGIGEEHIHNIFDAFSQAQGSMSREYGGTGLGLTLSKKLVAILGGAITVSSKLNKGSVFRFFIPAKSETPDTQDDYDTQDLTDKLMAMPELGLDTHTGHPRPRLLIAEDEKVGRVMAEMILEHRYQLCFASSGKEVVDSYFSFRPDIVLMDIIMPGMDGYQAFDAIRSAAVEKPVPIIAMTGQAMEEEKKEILAHGFDGYISKPVDEQLLIETIDRLLQKSTKRG